MSAAGGLQRPALDSMVPRLVPRDELPAAAALEGFRRNAGQIAGPALGGHPDRGRRAGRDLRRRRGDVPRLARRAGTDARRAAAARRRAAERRADRRGLALRAQPPGPDGHVPRRHQRDAVRDAGRAVPGGRRSLRRRGGARPAVRRRARRRAAAHADERLDGARDAPRPRDRGRARRSAAPPSPGSGSPARSRWRSCSSPAPGAADMSSGIFRSTLWNQTIPDSLRGRLAGIEQLSYSIGPDARHDAVGRGRGADERPHLARRGRIPLRRRHRGPLRAPAALLALRRRAISA